MTEDPSGRHIVVTRPDELGEELANRLRGLGASVFVLAAIRIVPGGDVPAARKALAGADRLLVSSRHGLLAVLGDGERLSSPPPVWAVGEATGRLCEEYGLETRITAASGGLAALVTDVLRLEAANRLEVVWVHGDLANAELLKPLIDAGHAVSEFTVYRNENPLADGPLPEEIENRVVDAALFASASAVRNFTRALPESLRDRYLESCAAVVIGESSRDAAAREGWKVIETAKRPSNTALVETVRELFSAP